MTCSTCRWYRPREPVTVEAVTVEAQGTLDLDERPPVHGYGLCRRFPPTSRGDVQRGDWPIVRDDDEGCGEHATSLESILRRPET